MQKYHTRSDSVHERAFAAPLGFCPLLFCAAHHTSRNAATCRRMPSLGVSSLDSRRSSERPPFFDNIPCNVRKRTKKGGVKAVSSADRSNFMSAILTHSARRRSRAPAFARRPNTRGSSERRRASRHKFFGR